MHGEFLQPILILLALAVAVVVIFRRLNQPAILGYLFIGLIAGPHVLDWIHSDEVTLLMGEIGVVFLLFTIGLEFSIREFIRMRYSLLGLGGTQVLIGTVSGMTIAMGFGIEWQAALIMGGALALSSTAIVMKQLSDQLELQQEHGRIALSILLFQDIAAIPFLVMIPIFAMGDMQNVTSLLLIALAKGVLALCLLLMIGRYLLRPLLHEVAEARSNELFTLAVLFIALLTAWFTNKLGLSLALGAFIAGMMLAETQYRHQIETEIRPFRDVLLGLFFITVGMQLNISVIATIWPWVILLLAGLVLGKGLLVVLLSRVARYPWPTSIRAGVSLAQGGEFGIALIALSISTGLINLQQVQPILAAIIISMGLAPVLIRNSHRFILSQSDDVTPIGDISDELDELNQHVIICGFGRTGQHLQGLLKDRNIPYVAIDNHASLVNAKWSDEQPVYFGDAGDIRLLHALGLKNAAAVLVTFNDVDTSLRLIRSLRQEQYKIPIIARAHNQNDMELLYEADATDVVPEDLETSLTLSTLLFLRLGMPMDDVLSSLEEMKKDQYSILDSEDI